MNTYWGVVSFSWSAPLNPRTKGIIRTDALICSAHVIAFTHPALPWLSSMALAQTCGKTSHLRVILGAAGKNLAVPRAHVCVSFSLHIPLAPWCAHFCHESVVLLWLWDNTRSTPHALHPIRAHKSGSCVWALSFSLCLLHCSLFFYSYLHV